ncbi:MAG: glycosyltransferase family 39 protein [Corynebacteriales bacterium]|nr:glycosyltransferase family 39 protein [Mycobacteriales bacterium]
MTTTAVLASAEQFPIAARGRLRRLLRGPLDAPRWERPAWAGLLLGTALLYIWALADSGWANPYYSAAAQAGAESWKALFFGSSDAANAITVDKTPASLWLMGISARLFGVNAWSILLPQALCGVATVAVLYAAVRRWYGPAAGLLSGAIVALTPVAVLMFRFNNPDALLVLLLVVSAYCLVRALERASLVWLCAAGSAIGFAFLAKMLQALLIVPAFGLVYLLVAPATVRQRVWHVFAALGALVFSAGWYVAIVALWPTGSRPYIGGSQHNSIIELTLGYNGLGRLNGEETGSVGPSSWGDATGWYRLFDSEMGAQISWLLPGVVIVTLAGVWVTRHGGRTDLLRAGFLLWGGWLLSTAAVFSYMSGIIHAYYTVALAPAIGALAGIGATVLWRLRHELGAAVALSTAVAATTTWSGVLLRRNDWLPWLSGAVLIGGFAAAVFIVLVGRLPARFSPLVATIAIAAVLTAPFSYSMVTASSTHTGAIPSAGPSGGGGFGAVMPQRAGGGMGGLLGASTPSDALTTLLKRDSDSYDWAAAVVGSNNAAGYQLASGQPVIAIGGFNGTDAYPTLEQFQRYVSDGRIHYFIASSMGGMPGSSTSGSDVAEQINSWVSIHYTATTVDGTTIYELS